MSQHLQRCVHLLQNEWKLEVFKADCASHKKWDPGASLECIMFIDDLVERVQRDGKNANMKMVQRCLTLLTHPPLSHIDLEVESFEAKAKRKGGTGGGGKGGAGRSGGFFSWFAGHRSGGGVSVWMFLFVLFVGSCAFGVFCWLVQTCYLVLLKAWNNRT